GGLLKWRRIEGRGGVAQVVLAESQAIIPVKVRLNRLEFAGEQRFLKQFLAQPQRQRHAKRGEAGWTQGKVRFQEAFEFDERFVVKDNEVDIFQLYPPRAQAKVDCVPRIAGVELLACEALFLRGSNDAAVLDQCSSTIMIEGRDTENAHSPTPLKNRVDEG